MRSDPNAPNGFGWTPIHSAARRGYTEIIKILAPLTANPNAPDMHGYTPIYLAKWAYRNCQNISPFDRQS